MKLFHDQSRLSVQALASILRWVCIMDERETYCVCVFVCVCVCVCVWEAPPLNWLPTATHQQMKLFCHRFLITIIFQEQIITYILVQ